MKNIYKPKKNSGWIVQRVKDGKREYYGSFKVLADAREYRDYLVEHDWNVEPVSVYDTKNYIPTRESPRGRVARMFGLKVEDLP